jgi:aryl-alcohol dehydrogenase-like predicted oxidoreductase
VTPPEFIYGTAGLHRIAWRPARHNLLRVAYDAGFRAFDTAPMYGDGLAEVEIGEALRSDRARIALTTKFGVPISAYGAARPWTFYAERVLRIAFNRRAYRAAFDRRDWSAQQMRADLEASLRRLKTDHVERFCLHEPLDVIPAGVWNDLLAAAEELKRQGKIGAFGISGQQACMAELSTRPGIDFVQTRIGRFPDLAAFPGRIFAYGFHLQFRSSGQRDFNAFLKSDPAGGRASAYLLSSTKPASVAAYAPLFG